MQIEHIYFCSRDGFLIKNAWEAAGLGERAGISSSYLYVSRQSLNLACGYVESTQHKLTASLTQFYADSWGGLTIKELVARVATLDPASLLADAKRTFGSLQATFTWSNADAFKDMLQRHAGNIRAALKKNYEATVSYLQQERLFEHARIAIVDLGWSGTFQSSINKLKQSIQASTDVVGFYYGLLPRASGNRFAGGWMEGAFASEFIELDRQPHLRNSIDILESLHTASHGSVASYEHMEGDWKPVCQTNEVEASQFLKVVAPFQAGVLDAVRIWSSGGEIAGVKPEEITLRTAISALGAIACSPSSKELYMLGKLAFCPTFEHKKFNTLVRAPMATDIPKMEEEVRSAGWQVGMLKYWYLLPDMPPRHELNDMARRALSGLGHRRLRQFQ